MVKQKNNINPKKGNIEEINNALNKKSNFKIYELIIFATLISVISIFSTFVLTKRFVASNNRYTKSNNKNEIAEFKEVYDLIESSYYKDVDKAKMIDGAINGMLSSLEDPHTSYFTKEETDNFNEVMNGSYEGIGAEISIDNNGNIIIMSVFKNSPAKDAGIMNGDIILEVNGKSAKGLTTTEVVTIIKDPNESIAKIKIKRNEEELTFNVEKRIVVIESVESEVINYNNKKIGYIVVNNFANNTYEQFRSNIEQLEKNNIKGLVIDVRGNTGGYLHSVTDMINMFLPKDKIIYQIADKKTTHKFTSTTDESRNYPVAVLVNKASASASEILAISLKESYGAYVVGTNTYGKGTVQTTKDLSSGAMIKFTIQKWLSPKGNWVNDVGVEPTHKIELTEEFINNPIKENDNQLNKALKLISESK